MTDSISDGYKVAMAAALLCVAVVLTLSLFPSTRKVLNGTLNNAEMAVASIEADTAYYISVYSKPVPIPSIWLALQDIGLENLTTFSIKTQNPGNPNDWILVSTDPASIEDYLACKGYMSWEDDPDTGLYAVEVKVMT